MFVILSSPWNTGPCVKLKGRMASVIPVSRVQKDTKVYGTLSYSPISHILTSCLIAVGPLHAAKTVPICQGMVSTSILNAPCDIKSRSFKSFKYWSGGGLVPRTVHSLTMCGVWQVQAHYPAERGHCHRGLPLTWRDILGLQQCLHMSNYHSHEFSSQGFSVKHCPEHHT